jgi:DNA-directed RNA polymerase I subunit RPA1
MPTGREEEAEAADDDDEEQGSKKKAKKGPKVGAVDAQTAEESIIRLEKYVEAQLHRASKRGGTKDAYKDGLVYQERRALLDDVLRVQSRSWRVKCTRCLA